MKPITLLCFCFFMAVGCAKKRADPPTDWGGRPITELGDYTDDEVKYVGKAISHLHFPVPAGTVTRLLLRPLKRRPVRYMDFVPDRENKGRVGGNVAEYWLNENYVLRVASAYYAQGENHFTMEEWAVILSRTEREHFWRPIYPGDIIIIYKDK